MSREVRRVPASWQHPRDERAQLRGLRLGFRDAVTDWDLNAAKWAEGLRRDYSGSDKWKPIGDEYAGMSYQDYNGERPVAVDYMPEWPEADRTHWQMYETTSEGTPISPVCETPEELAKWLADNNASSCGSRTATYSQWLNMIREGWAVTIVLTNGSLISGVEATSLEPTR